MTLRDLDKNDKNAPEQASPARVQARTRRLTCAHCGKQIEHRAGRRPQFCGSRCRMRANGQQRVRKAFLGGDARAPTKRKEFDRKDNALQRAKIQSSTHIIGPRQVLDVEIGRTWETRVSPDGVTVMVSRIRRDHPA